MTSFQFLPDLGVANVAKSARMTKPPPLRDVNKGQGRTKVTMSAYYMGCDLVLHIYNQNTHIGAVALGEYDHNEKRASTSVITRPGHKDDIMAQKIAHAISKHTQKPTCVIVGIHLDDITKEEIDEILQTTRSLIDEFVCQLSCEKEHGD